VWLSAPASWVHGEWDKADTWIFRQKSEVWQHAAEIPELALFLGRQRAKPAPRIVTFFQPGAGRCVKILAKFL
jgi:hypothetical protein